jgi:hypothetical protein
MPVAEIEQGTLLEPNRVFVIPPGKDITVKGNAFDLLTSVKPRALRRSSTVLVPEKSRNLMKNQRSLNLHPKSAPAKMGFIQDWLPMYFLLPGENLKICNYG